MKGAAFALFVTLLTPQASRVACIPAVGKVAASPARQTQEDGARKLDEFGNINVSDFLARLDNFAVELQTDPTAKGYVVAHIVPGNFPGWPLRRANWAKGYLVRGRGIDESRVEVFNAGYRDAVGFELWVVRAGGKLPLTPFDYEAELSREKTPYPFDRSPYYKISPDETGIESGYIGYLDDKGMYEPFATALRYDPAARGCIIAYTARGSRRGSDKRLASKVKLSILKNHPVGADRIVAIGGGQRPYLMVELWLVPPGAELPKPRPTVRPRRRARH